MWIDSMTVEFVYNTLTVYVTNAYPEGTCPYEQVLAHEKQHVQIHREVYQEYQRQLNWEEGKEALGKMINEVINPVFEDFEMELSRRNGLLDSAENYEELKSRCSDW
jgi:hypothetical protein